MSEENPEPAETPEAKAPPILTDYTLRPVRWELFPKKHGKHSDYLTVIQIEDEGAGEFVTIQQPMTSNDAIAIDADEWPHLRNAVERVWDDIRFHENNQHTDASR